MEGARGDKEDMVRADRAVARLYGCSLHQRQELPLDALALVLRGARGDGAVPAPAELVDLIDEDCEVGGWVRWLVGLIDLPGIWGRIVC